MMRFLTLAALVAAALSGLWLILAPGKSLQPIFSETQSKEVFTYVFTVSGMQVSGSSVISALQGYPVIVQLSGVDSADQLHLHGYELRTEVLPGQTASLNFIAKHSGVFELELHQLRLPIARLEVYPQ
jgi:heme/copper-type cytochrome/quinol oxidase subunit 2